MIIWALACLVDSKKRAIRFTAVVLLCSIGISSLLWYRGIRYVDYNWNYYCHQVQLKEKPAVSIPINPPGWYIEIHPRVVTVIN
jgi:hypothetical protein